MQRDIDIPHSFSCEYASYYCIIFFFPHQQHPPRSTKKVFARHTYRRLTFSQPDRQQTRQDKTIQPPRALEKVSRLHAWGGSVLLYHYTRLTHAPFPPHSRLPFPSFPKFRFCICISICISLLLTHSHTHAHKNPSPAHPHPAQPFPPRSPADQCTTTTHTPT